LPALYRAWKNTECEARRPKRPSACNTSRRDQEIELERSRRVTRGNGRWIDTQVELRDAERLSASDSNWVDVLAEDYRDAVERSRGEVKRCEVLGSKVT
jgi:hypothetical protein